MAHDLRGMETPVLNESAAGTETPTDGPGNIETGAICLESFRMMERGSESVLLDGDI